MRVGALGSLVTLAFYEAIANLRTLLINIIFMIIEELYTICE